VVIDRLWPGRVPAGPGSGEHPVGWLEFERFCRTAFPPVAAQLHAIIGDRARAHRLAHGAFAEAWRQWDKVSALPDRVSWVRRRAARQIRWSQRCRAVTGLLRRGRSDEPGAAGLLAALTRLPAVQRRALVLHHMAGLTPAQLADEENTSAKVVSQRLEHGRLALGHRAASGDWAKGDADVGAGQWAIAPIDDWVSVRRWRPRCLRAGNPRSRWRPPRAPTTRARWPGPTCRSCPASSRRRERNVGMSPPCATRAISPAGGPADRVRPANHDRPRARRRERLGPRCRPRRLGWRPARIPTTRPEPDRTQSGSVSPSWAARAVASAGNMLRTT
jgi:RNA polymerase sigma-70 factor (ECF subfamily)